MKYINGNPRSCRHLGAGLSRGPVAIRALLRSGLVEKDLPALHGSHAFMAVPARHVLVGASQRKRSPLLMIEQGRLPFGAIVTLYARSDAVLRELLSMYIFMTLFAFCRRRGEIYGAELGPEVRRLMTVDARGSSVCPEQRECGLGMIEGG